MMKRLYAIMKDDRKIHTMPFIPGIRLKHGMVPVTDCYWDEDGVVGRAQDLRNRKKELMRQIQAKKIMEYNIKIHHSIVGAKPSYSMENYKKEYIQRKEALARLQCRTPHTALHLFNTKPAEGVGARSPTPNSASMRSPNSKFQNEVSESQQSSPLKGGYSQEERTAIHKPHPPSRAMQSPMDKLDEDLAFETSPSDNPFPYPSYQHQYQSQNPMRPRPKSAQIRSPTNNDANVPRPKSAAAMWGSGGSNPNPRQPSSGRTSPPRNRAGDAYPSRDFERAESPDYNQANDRHFKNKVRPMSAAADMKRGRQNKGDAMSNSRRNEKSLSPTRAAVTSAIETSHEALNNLNKTENDNDMEQAAVTRMLRSRYPHRRFVLYSCELLSQLQHEEKAASDVYNVRVADVGIICPAMLLRAVPGATEKGEEPVATSSGVQVEVNLQSSPAINCKLFLTIRKLRLIAELTSNDEIAALLNSLPSRDRRAGLYSCLSDHLDQESVAALGQMIVSCIDIEYDKEVDKIAIVIINPNRSYGNAAEQRIDMSNHTE